MKKNETNPVDGIEIFDANSYVQLADDDILESGSVLTIEEAKADEAEGIFNTFETFMKEKKVLKVDVISADKDGNLIVPLGKGITGMIPNEEVMGEHYDNRKRSTHVGKKYISIVYKIDKEKKIVYLSREQARSIARVELRDKLIEALEKKQSIKITARVRFVSYRNKRVYIDMGGCGLFGFVAIKEWTHGFVYDPEKNIKPGTTIEVAVIGFKPANEKFKVNEAFICSRKRVLENPWDRIGQVYPKNSILITEARDVHPNKFFGPVPGFEDFEVYVEMPDNIGKPDSEKIFIIPGRKYKVRVYKVDEVDRIFKARVISEEKETNDETVS